MPKILHNTGSAGAQATTSATITPQPEAVQLQLERLLAHTLFQHSKRSSNLLKFVVEHSLSGDLSSLKERILGIEVFGRPADFETSLDSTVRTAAAELRRRLSLYYSEPAHRDELRIEIPVRSYIAEFKTDTPAAAPQPQLPAKLFGPLATAYSKLPVRLRWGAVAFLLFVLLAAASFRFFLPPSVFAQFWAPILEAPGSTFVMIGPPFSEPAPLPSPERLGDASAVTQARFPVGDVVSESAFVSFLGQHGKTSEAVFAHDTELIKLKGHSLIVLGSFRNPWAMRLLSGLRFQLKENAQSGERWIEDSTDPANRRWSDGPSSPAVKLTTEYVLVTRARNQSTDQWWIGIAGLRGAGSFGARLLLLDAKAMDALRPSLPVHWEQRNLQMVIAVDVVNDSPGAVHVLATHVW